MARDDDLRALLLAGVSPGLPVEIAARSGIWPPQIVARQPYLGSGDDHDWGGPAPALIGIGPLFVAPVLGVVALAAVPLLIAGSWRPAPAVHFSD